MDKERLGQMQRFHYEIVVMIITITILSLLLLLVLLQLLLVITAIIISECRGSGANSSPFYLSATYTANCHSRDPKPHGD